MKKYSEYSDKELVTMLQSGDQLAYTEIYDRFKTPLYRFLWQRIPEKEIIYDILHDLFLAVWEKRDQITYSSSLSGYLFTSVRNRLLDLIAHDKVKQKYIDSFYSFINLSEVSSDHLIRTKELSERIDQVIANLPPRTREVFELSRISNMSRKEIASKLDISEQTVKSHLFNALKTLKLELGGFLLLLFF